MIKETIKKNIPSFLISWYHFLLALGGAIFYWFPSRKIIVIGVTGTNGKSTVVELTAKILDYNPPTASSRSLRERAPEAGQKVASLSSIKFKIRDKEWSNDLKMTMPGRFQLQKFLRQAVRTGCKYAVLEVTSEGILQHRHRFINFEVAVFTNLTPEHIEAHGSFENYRLAKGKLFRATKEIHIINLDDKNSEYFLNFKSKEKYGYGISAENQKPNIKHIKAEDIQIHSSGIKFLAKNAQFNLSLLGGFNIYNALAAICVGLSQGIDLETLKSALEKIKGIPGRMEIVITDPLKVFVDFAFTPAALDKVYQTLKPEKKRMICVLGACGGGRDKWKRPVLGEIAAKHCNEVIVTNEDPYDENPMEIIEQVSKGTGGKAKKILDRRKAINSALKLAQPGDTVIITGKGSEPWMCVAEGKKIPWDDRKIVKEEFKKNRTMKEYEVLEHKADLRIRAFGKAKEELFLNMLKGMTESQKSELREEKTRKIIKISSPDLAALLVDFLSEILSLSQINKEAYSKANFKKFTDPSISSGQVEIEAEILGQKIERFGEDIKAVTYHELDVHQREDGIWEATVLFDI